MKIALCSDLHLEFGPIDLHNDNNADVLILSGDICVASELTDYKTLDIIPNKRSERFHEFFQTVCARFPKVLYVAGNHEHYHGDYAKTFDLLRDHLGYLDNLVIMDKQSLRSGDVMFIGGTLWTDMNKNDPMTIHAVRNMMNDYKTIADTSEVVHYKTFVNKDKPVGMTDGEWIALPYMDRVVSQSNTRPGKFTPAKSVAAHVAMLSFINETLNEHAADPSLKFVVVGHHAPCKLSTKPQYENDVLMNGAYSSDLSEFMLDRPRIVLWTHGHTHHPFDYMIGTCRVACNPRGYDGYEPQADNFELMYIDI